MQFRGKHIFSAVLSAWCIINLKHFLPASLKAGELGCIKSNASPASEARLGKGQQRNFGLRGERGGGDWWRQKKNISFWWAKRIGRFQMLGIYQLEVYMRSGASILIKIPALSFSQQMRKGYLVQQGIAPKHGAPTLLLCTGFRL